MVIQLFAILVAKSSWCLYCANPDLCVNNEVNKDDILSSSLFSQFVWSRIHLTGNDYLLLGLIYRSPNSDAIYKFQIFIQSSLPANNSRVSHLLITSDFNMPKIDWNNLKVISNNVGLYDEKF